MLALATGLPSVSVAAPQPIAQRLFTLDPLNRASVKLVAAGWGASLSAVATNLKAVPSNPLHLTFEFLDVAGQVIATLTQDIPAMPPRQTQAFDLKVSGNRVTGWRYRAS